MTARSYHSRALDLRDDPIVIKNVMQDRLLIRPIKEQSIIERIESHSNKPMKGEVLYAGPGNFDKKGNRQPLDVKPGDVVLFGPHATTELRIREENLLITREDNIFGVVE